MIDYIKFILSEHFKDLIGNGQNVEFKQILFIVFKPEIWQFMIKFAPERAVSLIAYIFTYRSCIKEVNHYEWRCFQDCQTTFKELVPRAPPTNAEKMLGHLSQTFRTENPELG
jgi:hypothetical protein